MDELTKAGLAVLTQLLQNAEDLAAALPALERAAATTPLDESETQRQRDTGEFVVAHTRALVPVARAAKEALDGLDALTNEFAEKYPPDSEAIMRRILGLTQAQAAKATQGKCFCGMCPDAEMSNDIEHDPYDKGYDA